MTCLHPVAPVFGAALLSFLVCSTASVNAQDLSFGLTIDANHGNLGGIAEFHGAPVFGRPGGVAGSWGVAGRADTAGNSWVGAGFVLTADITDQTFVEASFMPGYYRSGDTDLGHNVQFRSLLGFGWHVSPSGAVILSLDHISNADLDPFNPGTETVAIRYRFSF